MNNWMNKQCLKNPIGKRQTRWLYTKRSQGIELWATKNKSSDKQSGSLEPETNRLQAHFPNRSATLPLMIYFFRKRQNVLTPTGLPCAPFSPSAPLEPDGP